MTTIELRGIEHHDCSTASELLAALDPSSESWGGERGRWCFRGQDLDEPLVPTALRPTTGPESTQKDLELAPPSLLDSLEYGLSDLITGLGEFRAVEEFTRAADRAGLAIPHDGPAIREADRLMRLVLAHERHGSDSYDSGVLGSWPPNELLAIVALAQHYGVPTRLLDWTFRPFVAAYFAAARLAVEATGLPVLRPKYDKTKRMVVWALNMTAVLPNLGREDALPDSPPRIVIVEAPQATNPNLAAQAGLFTLDRDATVGVGLDSTLPELVRGELSRVRKQGNATIVALVTGGIRPPVVFRKFTLPHEEARKVLRLLGLHGISAATVFPGHRGVVESMYERRCWQR